MSKKIRSCLIILLLAFPSSASADFYYLAEGQLFVIKNEISYRVDADKTQRFEDVFAENSGWISQQEKPFKGTGEPVRLWAKFDLPPVTAHRRAMLDIFAWENVEYFVVRDGRLVDRQVAGTLVPMTGKATQVSMTPSFFHAGFAAIDQPADANITVYARLATSNRFVNIPRLHIVVWDADQVREGEQRDRIVQGIFIGIVLVLALYNLALFVLDVRELSYLYYVIGELGSCFIFALMFGLSSEFVWPNHPTWDYFGIWTIPGISTWAMVQFVRHYLDTRRHFPRYDVVLKWAAISALLLISVFWLAFAIDRPMSLTFTLRGYLIVIVVNVVLMVAVTGLALKRGHPLAPLFAVAVFLAGAGLLISAVSMMKVNVMGASLTTDWAFSAIQIGNAMMGILLSMGLGFRMRHLRDELADTRIKEALLQGTHEREKREFIQQQSHLLEAKVEERTVELKATQEKSDALLTNILPRAIIDELKATGESEPRRHEDASILFTDFSGFTQAVSTIPAKRLVKELDEIFRGFDDIIAANGLEKIKTIGDAYMAAAGLPLPADDHAVRCVRAGLALTQFIETRNQTAAMKWGLRVGVHSGAVVAGIVGKNKYAYDVWGDTVNIASRLESAGEVNKVNISAYTFELVQAFFECEYRGKLAAKGKGEIDMYFVLRERVPIDATPTAG